MGSVIRKTVPCWLFFSRLSRINPQRARYENHCDENISTRQNNSFQFWSCLSININLLGDHLKPALDVDVGCVQITSISRFASNYRRLYRRRKKIIFTNKSTAWERSVNWVEVNHSTYDETTISNQHTSKLSRIFSMRRRDQTKYSSSMFWSQPNLNFHQAWPGDSCLGGNTLLIEPLPALIN